MLLLTWHRLVGSVGEDTAHICEKRELLTKEGVTFTQELKVQDNIWILFTYCTIRLCALTLLLRCCGLFRQVEGSCLHSFE